MKNRKEAGDTAFTSQGGGPKGEVERYYVFETREEILMPRTLKRDEKEKNKQQQKGQQKCETKATTGKKKRGKIRGVWGFAMRNSRKSWERKKRRRGRPKHEKKQKPNDEQPERNLAR